MSKFQIFTDSNSELDAATRKAHHLEYVHMGVTHNGEDLPADLDWKQYSPEELYGWMKDGHSVKTSAVSMAEFDSAFRPFLEKGIDIIYIACSTKLTASLNTCRLASEELLKEFPERRIVGIDSLNACFCLGMIAIDAAKKQDEGLSMDEVIQWVEDNKLKYNFFATVETLTYMKRAGRIKGSKAFMGNLFGVKPIFISDAHGNNFGIKTVRGTKKADEELVECLKKVIDVKARPEVYVGHAVCLERAQKVKERLEKEVPGIKVSIGIIGPIVGATTGPGMLAVFCYGKEVTRYEGDGIKE